MELLRFLLGVEILVLLLAWPVRCTNTLLFSATFATNNSNSNTVKSCIDIKV